MKNVLEKISCQIDEIRNFIASLDKKLAALDFQIIRSRKFFESKTGKMET